MRLVSVSQYVRSPLYLAFESIPKLYADIIILYHVSTKNFITEPETTESRNYSQVICYILYTMKFITEPENIQNHRLIIVVKTKD